MKILVTGGSGFIGTVLIKKLLLDGYKVNCLDLNSVIMTSWFAQAAPNDIIIVREVNNPEKVGYFRLISVFTALPLPTPEGTCVAEVSYISGIDYTSNWPEITSPPTSYYIGYVVYIKSLSRRSGRWY